MSVCRTASLAILVTCTPRVSFVFARRSEIPYADKYGIPVYDQTTAFSGIFGGLAHLWAGFSSILW